MKLNLLNNYFYRMEFAENVIKSLMLNYHRKKSLFTDC